jgi:putative nucleotidyltransferase with HDIG domain
MSPEFSKELVDAIDRMQAFPVSVQNILKLTRDAGSAPRELVEVIQRDPIVTIKVLRVVNSAYYSLPRQVTSIDHAVVLLGFNTIKNLALGIAAVGMLPSTPRAVLDSQRYLNHSLTAAAVARQLGARFPALDAHDFFIAGLLHDFGKVVLAQVMPEPFNQALEFSLWHEVPMHQALLEVTGIDHAELGAMLLEKWRFPSLLVEGIRWQNSSDAHDSPIALCVYAANQVCRHAGVDFAGDAKPQAFSSTMERALGGTLDHVIESLGDVAAILQEARQFSAH